VPTLTVSGKGSMIVVPDLAVVTLGVLSQAKTANEALNANSANLTSVIDAVMEQGVRKNDIGTSAFSIRPVYQRLRPDEIGENLPAVIGYEVSNQIRVVIRDIASSGDLLDKVVKSGANRVSGISFDIDDREAAADAALANAIADARRKAEIMADTAGMVLVRILSISSGADAAAPVFERAMTLRTDAAPVMPGTREITGRATVTWEIAPR